MAAGCAAGADDAGYGGKSSSKGRRIKAGRDEQQDSTERYQPTDRSAASQGTGRPYHESGKKAGKSSGKGAAEKGTVGSSTAAGSTDGAYGSKSSGKDRGRGKADRRDEYQEWSWATAGYDDEGANRRNRRQRNRKGQDETVAEYVPVHPQGGKSRRGSEAQDSAEAEYVPAHSAKGRGKSEGRGRGRGRGKGLSAGLAESDAEEQPPLRQRRSKGDDGAPRAVDPTTGRPRVAWRARGRGKQ